MQLENSQTNPLEAKLTLEPIPFYFLRHGETDWNLKLRAMGQSNQPLNQTGVRQAHEAAHILGQNSGIKTIVTSPLIRARHTAEIVQAKVGCPIIEMPDLMELNWGPMEGRALGDRKWIEEWVNGQVIDGMETNVEFFTRVITGMNMALQNPGLVLIVSHGGVWWELKKFFGGNPEGIKNAVPHLVRPPKQENQPWFVCPLES